MLAHNIIDALKERLLIVEEKIGVHKIDIPKLGTFDYEFREGSLRSLRDEQAFLKALIVRSEATGC